MRSPNRWEQLEGAEKAAKFLARFVALQDIDVQEFRDDVQDFLPSGIWIRPEAWQPLQEFTIKAWRKKLPPEMVISLIGTCAQFSDMERVVGAIFHGSKDAAALKMLPAGVSPQNVLPSQLPAPKMYGFQKAVMYLSMESWRPRVCNQCGKLYVANTPSQETCSIMCRTEQRQKQQAQNWAKSGRKYRKHAVAKKAKARRTA